MQHGAYFNLYRHNFLRVAVAVPRLRVADPAYNAAETLVLVERAAAEQAAVVVFPELGLSAYSCDDLFQQQALLDGVLEGLRQVRDGTATRLPVVIVGLPLRVGDSLYNCAAVLHRGRILGVVPKTYLPNYREFYEARQFTSGDAAAVDSVSLLGQPGVPFGSRLVFAAEDQALWRFHVEICEDLWVPIAPSSLAALAGASVLVNLSASNITVAKDDYRQQLVADQSARCIAGYLYTAAGTGESTTDLAWDGHGMIYENGSLIGETRRFQLEAELAVGDLDLDRLVQDRMRQTSFGQSRQRFAAEVQRFRIVPFTAGLPTGDTLLLGRRYERFPYVPSNPGLRDERCEETYRIQVQGLVKRLEATRTRKIVIGVSGGLDSTQALIVCARAMDLLELPRGNILAYTMPGFATTDRTLQQAHHLMRTIGCSAAEIDIRPSCLQLLKDIGHPFARGDPVYDITFENVQAGERTNHLFRLANRHGAFVVGTSDLSELALGWSTYGVGDHMAHYHVNASVPKTLIQYLIRWVADTDQLGLAVSPVLREVLATTVSPELIPGDAPQSTEATVGPYELQDFHLYYTLRFGYLPQKVAFMAWHAWRDAELGNWPEIPELERHQYPMAEIKRWLAVFLRRFFQVSQYKRSAIPNAPKVGSGGSLSPRGDWRAPSDSEATAWIAALAEVPEQEP